MKEWEKKQTWQSGKERAKTHKYGKLIYKPWPLHYGSQPVYLPCFWQVIPDMHKSKTFLPTVSLPPRHPGGVLGCTRSGGLWRNALTLLLPQGCLSIVQMTCHTVKSHRAFKHHIQLGCLIVKLESPTDLASAGNWVWLTDEWTAVGTGVIGPKGHWRHFWDPITQPTSIRLCLLHQGYIDITTFSLKTVFFEQKRSLSTQAFWLRMLTRLKMQNTWPLTCAGYGHGNRKAC